ncbi:hypothetical protein M422DRAFT_54606 [Sphaerobolus stellatus SS14]|uniref:Uncharacterized protein n=1 Tax=Sphaerobolus stellatus (strain SS14) TaxID=990650 RepID=A0A0C9U2U5_SPHS4|nr:hypothetical protein M422DRAFT_54606 [Sphaerobolus stellatus SS14]
MNIDLDQLKVSLAPVKAQLGSDEVLKGLKTLLNDPAMIDQIAQPARRDAALVAENTIIVKDSFVQGQMDIDNLRDRPESLSSSWRNLSQSFTTNTTNAVSVARKTIDFYNDFNTALGKIEMVDTNFEKLKTLVSETVQVTDLSQHTGLFSHVCSSKDPLGAVLATDSQKLSQTYTDIKGGILEYQVSFQSWVDIFIAETDKTIQECYAEIDRLQGEISKCFRLESQAASIEDALAEITGIPEWLWWIIAGLLSGIGFVSVEAARQALVEIRNEQERLRALKSSVLDNANKAARLSTALTSAKNTLKLLSVRIADITDGLASFAMEWAKYHHDIVLIAEEMQAAADSATINSLIARLKLLSTSLSVLTSQLALYVTIVTITGDFLPSSEPVAQD